MSGNSFTVDSGHYIDPEHLDNGQKSPEPSHTLPITNNIRCHMCHKLTKSVGSTHFFA